MCERVALRALTASSYEIVRTTDAAVIGEIEAMPDEPAAGWLAFGFIALAEGERGWGYGSEAVRLLEGEAKAERFLTRVDARNGLALYFWLRLGYRPARPGEVPGGRRRGIISMVRQRTANQEPRA